MWNISYLIINQNENNGHKGNENCCEVNEIRKVAHANKLVVIKISNIANFNFQPKEKYC